MPKLTWSVQPKAGPLMGFVVIANTRDGAIAQAEATFLREKAERIKMLSEPADEATEEDRAELAKACAYWQGAPCPTYTAIKLGRA